MVCVWGPIWDVPWTYLLICFEKLVLCSRNSRVRHFFKKENMKRKCTEKKCSHFVQLRLKTIRQIADTNTIFTVAGICSTTDFFAVGN